MCPSGLYDYILLLNILVPAHLKIVVLLNNVREQREAVCATELRVTVIIKATARKLQWISQDIQDWHYAHL